MLKELIYIILVGVFANNYVLQQTTGICPFLGVSKKFDQAAGMGAAVIFVMLCATAATYPIQKFILEKPINENGDNLEYLQTIVFILVIAALVQFVEIVLKKFIPSLHKSLGVYLPLITTNCAVLGVTINNLKPDANGEIFTFLEAMISSLGVGLGFLLAMVLFAGLREQLALNNVPKAFRGIPIALITASLLAMALMGFSGLV